MIAILGLALALASIGGAAYLLTVWHEDQRSGTRGWPLSRVVAYLAVGACIAANILAAVTLLRLLEVPNFRAIQLALQPLTLPALIYLDVVFTILALYLRVVRATGYMTPSERAGLATEASVQEAITAARDAYHEANTVNQKIANLTEALGHKEDKP